MTPSDWYDAACRQMAEPPGEFDESKCGGRPMITLDEKDTLVTALSAKMDADVAAMWKILDRQVGEWMFKAIDENNAPLLSPVHVYCAGDSLTFKLSPSGDRDFDDFRSNVLEQHPARDHVGFMYEDGAREYSTFYDTAEILHGPYRNTPEDVARAVKETK